MTNIAALPLVERVRQDVEPIAAIYRNLGTSAAERVVTRALAELGLAMGGLARQVRLHDLADVSRRLRKVQRMAEHLGMVSLGMVADDARTCFDRSDATAFSAVWARLIRVTECSLSYDRACGGGVPGQRCLGGEVGAAPPGNGECCGQADGRSAT